MAIVTTAAQFAGAVSRREPEITVANDIVMTSMTNIGYALTLNGNAGVSLIWGGTAITNRTLLNVTSGGALEIESLTLDGGGRDVTLVQVTGGSLTTNDGVILKNVHSTSANGAVKLNGGAFTMNGGLITEIDTSDAVFCRDGTVTMNNDAAVKGNMAAGVTVATIGATRAKLIMAGQSTISGNTESRDVGGAGMIVNADVIMGVQEGDAPSVTENHSDFYCGAWILTSGSSLTMNYKSEISGNSSPGLAGALGVRDSVVTMRGDAAIKNNTSVGVGSGLFVTSGGVINMEERAAIEGNTSGDRGGGIFMQSGAILNMQGDSSVSGNIGASGAGLYLTGASTIARIGVDGGAPAISGNRAQEQGGGIFISEQSVVKIAENATVSENEAPVGKGIYKEGELHLAGTAKILDGLFFDDLQNRTLAVSHLEQSGGVTEIAPQIRLEAPEHMMLAPLVAEYGDSANAIAVKAVALSADAADMAYTDNVPVIDDNLMNGAAVQLEASDYVSPLNVPVIISDKDAACNPLGNPDCVPWRIPDTFGLGYAVLVTDGLDQVFIGLAAYTITYNDLFGAKHSNPDSYNSSDLPIALQDPEARQGYTFAGWYDESGVRVTEISAGTTGNIVLKAVWEPLARSLSFDGNAPCVCNVPEAISVQEGKAVIPPAIPCRPCHHFIGWNIPESGSGKVYFPGDTIVISGSSVKLRAQWQALGCRCNDKKQEKPRGYVRN